MLAMRAELAALQPLGYAHSHHDRHDLPSGKRAYDDEGRRTVIMIGTTHS
jgi:hypothetical protein